MTVKTPQSSRSGPPASEIYTVSRLNREARQVVENRLGSVWVEGEISNLARPASGHMYFSLKDGQAQVRCAMFRGANRQLRFQPKDGSQVLVQAKAGIYEARGEFQLVAEKMEDAGEGALRRKFEELKARLSEAGLFAEEHKQSIPALPACIGVVTSATGAAVRDILNILKRRYPAARVIIYPTRVQGDGADKEIARAIGTAVERSECDVLIIARGGGSLEDLWSFNEEIVAQAIYACPLPTVAGIGHEVDVTIADLVADVRAPTPSGAAELVAPDSDAMVGDFAAMERRGGLAIQRVLTTQLTAHNSLQGRLKRMHPGAVLNQSRQRLDDLLRSLASATQQQVREQQVASRQLSMRLKAAAPVNRLIRMQDQLTTQRRGLGREIQRVLQQASSRFAAAAAGLNTVSPLATLERGYAIVQTVSEGEVLRDAANAKPGDRISAKLAQGSLEATVDKVRKS